MASIFPSVKDLKLKSLIYPILVVIFTIGVLGDLLRETVEIATRTARLEASNQVGKEQIRGCIRRIVIIYSNHQEEFAFPYAQPIIIKEESIGSQDGKYKSLIITLLQKNCD